MQKSKKQESFQSRFLFVNHDTSNRNVLPHRQAIFSHVQKNSRRQQRFLEDKSSQALTISSQCQSKIGPRSRRAEDKEDQEQSKDDDRDDGGSRKNVVNLRVQRKDVSPVTIIGRGNSDPFSAMAIPVDAEGNEVLVFGREYLISALFNVERTYESVTASQNWKEIVTQLTAQGPAFGFMAFFSTAMSVVSKNPSDKRRALRHQVACTTLLRKTLTNAEVAQYPNFIAQILSLFSCEILTRNLLAAKTHSKILRQLFETSAENGLDIAPQLSYALYHDSNLSAMFLVRPTFDFDDWTSLIFEPYWAAAFIQYPQLCEEQPEPLDQSLAHVGVLTDIMVQLRKLLHFWKLVQDHWSDAGIPPLVMISLVPRSAINQGRLINYYHDLMDDPQFLKKFTPEELWTHAYICLAAIYHHHVQKYNPVIAGVALFDTTTLGLQYLQNAIVQSEKTSTTAGRQKFEKTRLWALFVGASAERVPSNAPRKYDVKFAWFNARFKSHALSMGLHKWEDIRKILLGFPFAANCVPPPDWVDEHLRVAYDKEGKIKMQLSPLEFVIETPESRAL